MQIGIREATNLIRVANLDRLYIVWNSFSTAETSGSDYYGNAMESTGSFWWWLTGQ